MRNLDGLFFAIFLKKKKKNADLERKSGHVRGRETKKTRTRASCPDLKVASKGVVGHETQASPDISIASIFEESLEMSICGVCEKEIISAVERQCGGCNKKMHITCGDEKMFGTKPKDKIGLCDTCKEKIQLKQSASASAPPAAAAPASAQKPSKKAISETTNEQTKVVIEKTTFMSPSLQENNKVQDMLRLAFIMNMTYPGTNGVTFLDKALGNKPDRGTEPDHDTKKALTKDNQLFAAIMEKMTDPKVTFSPMYGESMNFEINFILEDGTVLNPDEPYKTKPAQKWRALQNLWKNCKENYQQ